MKSPESYKKEYPESAKSKFAIPRDAEGKPNKEVFGIIQSFEDKLSKYDSFIGVAPYGSKVRGYSSEQSDTDLAIFIEEPSTENLKPNDLHKDAIENSYAYGGPDKIHIEFELINEGAIKHAIVNPNNYPGRFALVKFLGVASGPKVNEYRKIFADQVNDLPKAKKVQFLKELIDIAVTLEDTRTSRVEERIPSMAGVDLKDIRRPLWEKRIADILKKP